MMFLWSLQNGVPIKNNVSPYPLLGGKAHPRNPVRSIVLTICFHTSVIYVPMVLTFCINLTKAGEGAGLIFLAQRLTRALGRDVKVVDFGKREGTPPWWSAHQID